MRLKQNNAVVGSLFLVKMLVLVISLIYKHFEIRIYVMTENAYKYYIDFLSIILIIRYFQCVAKSFESKAVLQTYLFRLLVCLRLFIRHPDIQLGPEQERLLILLKTDRNGGGDSSRHCSCQNQIFAMQIRRQFIRRSSIYVGKATWLVI